MNESETLTQLRGLAAALLGKAGPGAVTSFLNDLHGDLHLQGNPGPAPLTSPYVNTIAAGDEPEYPGDLEIENRLKSYVRWNAMAMVVQANRKSSGLGGHISTYASAATLYEVGYNHFFRHQDLVYFQGHASPGNYARAYLENRLPAASLHHFRRELVTGGGLPSYPHPRLMPEFWQFPTVSMGLGPIMSIYQARFIRYLQARGLLDKETDPRVWAFVGDGETDEPETRGALSVASREKLDNLIWVVNCNLQRLDGPVRGNSKIVQELESAFRGAGWNVIKVLWGSNWDPLLAQDKHGLLRQRMEDAVDGDYQKYSAEPGSYARKHFFGASPELAEMVNHLKDKEIVRLLRGGHDPVKVYAAYARATAHSEGPTVILAKTIKGYGLGEAGEGRNVTHQQKKLDEKELREFRDRFRIPISDAEIAEAPFYRPPAEHSDMVYLRRRREALGGPVPERRKPVAYPRAPAEKLFQTFYAEFERPLSTTMAFVRLLTALLRDPDYGPHMVPIIPDEARTFGMDSLFRQMGIYAPEGQLYDPVDRAHLLYYRESGDGQILEEGITEAGSMGSFIAAGTSASMLGVPMVPFYIFYSMFGFQRVGDLIWAAGDSEARGFLLGATAGRTTLNGEGLQHQDGHSHLLAAAYPHVQAYDPACAFEVAVIIREGMLQMQDQGNSSLYYVTLYNENTPMPAMPEGAAQGIIEGMYLFRPGERRVKPQVQLLGSGPILHETLRAQEILADRYAIGADVWSVTSYQRLRLEAVKAQRWNRAHPDQPASRSYLERTLPPDSGPFIAASDNIRLVADQIAPWVPGGLTTLGTDGFGRSDTRAALRRYFEIDAEAIVLASLYALSQRGEVESDLVSRAFQDLNVDPEQICPF